MEEIFEVDFFVETFFFVLKSAQMSIDGIHKGEYSNARLERLWNSFWNYLPDNENIRTSTFFNLCNMCDGTYDPQDETEHD